jgi:hypothetical protein
MLCVGSKIGAAKASNFNVIARLKKDVRRVVSCSKSLYLPALLMLNRELTDGAESLA